MISPASVVPTQLPALAAAPGSPPAPGAEADDVSFDALLAAVLGVPTRADDDPLAVVGAQENTPQPKDAVSDGPPSAESPPQPLDVVVSAPVPLPLVPVPVALPVPIEAQVPSMPAAAPEPSAAGAAKPSLPEPAAGAAKATVRVDPAPVLSVTDPEPQLPDPASIAVRVAGVHAPAEPASTPVAAAEARPNADLLLAQRQGADAPPGVTPMPSERVDSLPRAPVQPVRLDVAAPIGSREFGAELGNRVVWMATNHHQVAELRIDPPQLGPVELRLSIAHDQASLSIASPHAAVRDAIQASLPRLQDLLQGLGINLGEVTVGAEGLGGGSSDRSGLAQDWSRGEHALPVQVYPPHTGTAAGIGPLRAGIGMIDVYA